MSSSSLRPIVRTFTAALMLAAASLAPAIAQDDEVLATVNGSPITEAELELAMNDLDQQFQQLSPEQRRAAALSALIEIRLLASRAEEEGLGEDAEFQRRMTFLRERALHSAFVEQNVANALTDEEVRARYDQEIAGMQPGEEVRASHILVETEEEARSLIEQLDGGADFAELAEEHSSDGSAQNGGDLGFFGQGRMVPEFEQAAFGLEVDAHTAEPVQSQFGWHVIKVTERRQQQPPAFEQVENQVRSILLREKYMEEVESIREAAEIDITNEELRAAIEGAEAQQGEEGEAEEAAPDAQQ